MKIQEELKQLGEAVVEDLKTIQRIGIKQAHYVKLWKARK